MQGAVIGFSGLSPEMDQLLRFKPWKSLIQINSFWL